MKGKILNKKVHGIPKNSVYIGRGSKYGNPFRIGVHGSREEVIQQYKFYLLDRLEDGTITIEELIALYEHDLVCYCYPLPCHGDVIHYFGKLLRQYEGM